MICWPRSESYLDYKIRPNVPKFVYLSYCFRQFFPLSSNIFWKSVTLSDLLCEFGRDYFVVHIVTFFKVFLLCLKHLALYLFKLECQCHCNNFTVAYAIAALHPTAVNTVEPNCAAKLWKLLNKFDRPSQLISAAIAFSIGN